MGTRGDKRRKQQKQRRQRRSAKRQSATPTQLGRPIRLIAEHVDWMAELPTDSTLQELVAQTEHQLVAKCEDLAQLAGPHDLFEIVEAIGRIEMAVDPETYQETQHEGMAAAIELVCQLSRARGTRRGLTPTQLDFAAIQDIQQLAREALDLGSRWVLLKTKNEYGSEGDLSIGPRLREVFLRNVAFPHMLRDSLDALFADRAVDDDCRVAAGCTYSEIVRAFDAIEELWADRETTFRRHVRSEIEHAYKLFEEGAVDPETIGDKVRRSFNPLPGDFLTIGSVAARSGLEKDVVAAVLKAFSSPLAESDVGKTALAFFTGESVLLQRPFVDDGEGGHLLPHPALLLPSVRVTIENHLKAAGKFTKYSERRGGFLEEEALGYLKGALPLADIHGSTKYFVPNKDRGEVETSPELFTSLGECDGLVLIDDVALIVEAKSSALSPIARTGDLKRVKSDLRKIVSEASKQAERLRLRIETDGGLRLRDESWLDLSQIRETHTITVSLEDLSGYATLTSALFEAGLLNEVQVPWSIGLHDLRIICELCDRPSELLAYIRRRTNADVTRWFLSMDELDYFMQFLQTGLFVEPDPAIRFDALPELGPPKREEIRRRKRMKRTILLSQTDPIDAWYLYSTGQRETAASKPEMNANPNLQKLVDRLEASEKPGWLRAGTTLLMASGKLQNEFARYPAALAKRVAEDDATHTHTVTGGSSQTDSFVMVWAVAPAAMPLSGYIQYLSRYVAAKKHQLQVGIGVGLVFAPDNLGSPVSLIYNNSPPGEDEHLDREVDEFNLLPVGSMRDELLR